MVVRVEPYTKVVNGRTVTVRGYSTDGNDAAHQAAGTFDRPQIAASVGEYAQGATPEGKYGGGRVAPGLFPDPRLAQQTYQPTPEQQTTGLGLAMSLPGMVALSADDEWTSAAAAALRHVALVIKNNPKKTLDQILARPDVQDALATAGRRGAQATTASVEKAWRDNGGPPRSPQLRTLLADAVANGASFRRRMNAALTAADKAQLDAELRKYALRSKAGEDTAATRARTEAFLAGLETGAEVEWVARTDAAGAVLDDVCPACRALHGTTATAGQEFDRTAGGARPPYFLLVGPPRHPGCRCRLRLRARTTT